MYCCKTQKKHLTFSRLIIYFSWTNFNLVKVMGGGGVYPCCHCPYSVDMVAIGWQGHVETNGGDDDGVGGGVWGSVGRRGAPKP